MDELNYLDNFNISSFNGMNNSFSAVSDSSKSVDYVIITNNTVQYNSNGDYFDQVLFEAMGHLAYYDEITFYYSDGTHSAVVIPSYHTIIASLFVLVGVYSIFRIIGSFFSGKHLW